MGFTHGFAYIWDHTMGLFHLISSGMGLFTDYLLSSQQLGEEVNQVDHLHLTMGLIWFNRYSNGIQYTYVHL